MQAILDEMLASADVNVGLAFSLTTQLENVLASLDRKNTTAATNMLQGVNNEIEELIQAGRLSSADGQLLIDTAQSAIGPVERIVAPN